MPFTPEVTLLFPRSSSDGQFLEKLAHFAARGDRSIKPTAELWDEIEEAGFDKRKHFLDFVLREEWALDVAELNIFVWHINNIPSWLVTEWLRHRMVARDYSFEQLSKRAIHAYRMEVINPFDKEIEQKEYELFQWAVESVTDVMRELQQEGVPAEKIRYLALEGTSTRLTVGANARALHHFFHQRGTEDIGGTGRAAPEFKQLVGIMYEQAKEVCPILFANLIGGQ